MTFLQKLDLLVKESDLVSLWHAKKQSAVMIGSFSVSPRRAWLAQPFTAHQSITEIAKFTDAATASSAQLS